MEPYEIVIPYHEYIRGKTPGNGELLIEFYINEDNKNLYNKFLHKKNKDAAIELGHFGYKLNRKNTVNINYKFGYIEIIQKQSITRYYIRIEINKTLVIPSRTNTYYLRSGNYLYLNLMENIIFNCTDFSIENMDNFLILGLYFESYDDALEVYNNNEYLDCISKRLKKFEESNCLSLGLHKEIYHKKSFNFKNLLKDWENNVKYKSERCLLIGKS